MMIFMYGLSAASSMVIALVNVRKSRYATNRLFIFICITMTFEAVLIGILNAMPWPEFPEIAAKLIVFIPVPAFAAGLFMAVIFPSGRISRHRSFIVILLLLIVADLTFIFFTPVLNINIVNPDFSIVINIYTLIQIILIFLLLIAIPGVMLVKISGLRFRRIKNVVFYYVSGLFFVYLAFAAVHAAGIYYFNLSLLANPASPVPVFFMLLITNHLVFEAKNNNFSKYYLFLVYTSIFFVLLFVPVYLFLKYLPLIPVARDWNFFIHGIIILAYFVLVYRLVTPFRRIITRRRYNSVLHSINETLIPVKELNRITENSSFFRNITNDNFQVLENALGVQAAYFMLLDRKSGKFRYTFGFGPEVSVREIEADSEIIKCLAGYKNIFEKSDLLTDFGIGNINKSLMSFLDDNDIDVSMPFVDMADTVVGFLLLGKLRKGKPYSRDILDALEIYRIKLQSLLITGLILDEVTAEQVSEHDRLVVNVVKQRIIPHEMDTVKGIRISSLHINNSDMGGDYFDAVRLSRDKAALFMADLSYSGVDSALLGLELYSMLHSRALIFNFPEKMLNMMNQVLGTSRITNSYSRCCSVIFSSDGNYMYSNASFNPMIIYDHDKDELSEIESAGIPMGIEKNHRYLVISGRLKEESIAILYSDGLLSSCNSAGETPGMGIIQDTVKKYWRESPAVIVREIYNSYRSFTGDMRQPNDVSLIVIKKVKSDAE